MEIKEVVTYYLNPDSNILEVDFRTIEDSEDLMRSDNINYNLVEDYGYILEVESFDFFGGDDEDFEDFDENQIELDENELKSFLTEYYTLNPESLPKAEFY